jgi:hypothetical protein
VGEELFHADGRTDIKKLIIAFRSFAKAPETLACLSLLPITGFVKDGPHFSYIA